jgi:nitrate reductase gamma subunit
MIPTPKREIRLDTIVGLIAGVAIVLVLLGITRRERNNKNRGAMTTERTSALLPLALTILALCGFYWSYAAAISEHYLEAVFLSLTSIIVLPKSVQGLFPRR